MNNLDVEDILLLLKFYVSNQVFYGETASEFYPLCDRYIARDTEQLEVFHLHLTLKLFSSQRVHNSLRGKQFQGKM